MALKEVLKYLKRLDGAAPATPPGDTQAGTQFVPADPKRRASNDPEPPTATPVPAAPPPPRKSQGQRYQEWVATWKPMANAYHAHHFGCPTCISAGKGYGLRCGAGAALWTAYSERSAGDPP